MIANTSLDCGRGVRWRVVSKGLFIRFIIASDRFGDMVIYGVLVNRKR